MARCKQAACSSFTTFLYAQYLKGHWMLLDLICTDTCESCDSIDY